MANTGYKNFLTLKKYINGVATNETKTNASSDPDYIAPVLDLNNCAQPSNSCPQVSSAISDITVDVGAPQETISLSSVFTDADGDTLSYTATSSNSAGVQATINGNSLEITYSSNTATASNITVTASDGTCSATDSFSVTINEVTVDPGTTTTTTAAPTVFSYRLFRKSVGATSSFTDMTDATSVTSFTVYSSDSALVENSVIYTDEAMTSVLSSSTYGAYLGYDSSNNNSWNSTPSSSFSNPSNDKLIQINTSGVIQKIRPVLLYMALYEASTCAGIFSATSTGGNYYLDQGSFATAGSDFEIFEAGQSGWFGRDEFGSRIAIYYDPSSGVNSSLTAYDSSGC